jgi:cytochrome bd-type quinol oxidase subunit 2
MPTNDQHTEKNIQWDIISAATGGAGLIMAFVPYLSILGIGLCVVGLVLGFIAKRKKQRKRWYRIGIFCGSLGIVALLGVLGLMAFF